MCTCAHHALALDTHLGMHSSHRAQVPWSLSPLSVGRRADRPVASDAQSASVSAVLPNSVSGCRAFVCVLSRFLGTRRILLRKVLSVLFGDVCFVVACDVCEAPFRRVLLYVLFRFGRLCFTGLDADSALTDDTWGTHRLRRQLCPAHGTSHRKAANGTTSWPVVVEDGGGERVFRC